MLEVPKTEAIKSLRDKSREHEEVLAHSLPYITAVNDGVIMMRDGDLIASFTVEGINADTADTYRVKDIAEVLSRLIAQEPDNVAFYIQRISHLTKPQMKPVDGEGFTAEIDKRWQRFLHSNGMRERTNLITLVIRPPRVSGLFTRFSKDNNARRAAILKRAERLERLVQAFMEALGETKPERMSVQGGKWLGLLRTTISSHYASLVPGVKFIPISDLIVNTNINFTGDLITIFGLSSETFRYATMLTLKSYPESTYPGMLDSLNLPFDMVVTHSFTRTDNVTALARIERVKRQRLASEDAAVSLREQLPQAADDVASGRVVFGDHHATVCLFALSEAELNEGVSLVNRAVTEAGGSIIRENFAAAAEYFAQHPANFSYRTRPAMISSMNFAELAAPHGSSRGLKQTESPWGECVTILPTVRGEPYRFNFHLGGSLDERTLGHTVVLGLPGSGKTLGTAFLISQAARLNPRIIVFDKDRGFESAIRAMDGDYTAVRLGEPTGFNPFQAESDERGSAWLTDWLEALAVDTAGELSAPQIDALAKAVLGNKGAQAGLQNFEAYRSQFRSTDDSEDLYTRFGRWTGTGQYGWLFNGKDQDSLALDNDLVAFDLTEIFDNDTVRTAWLSYVFRRIERLVEDERPTLIVLDEAWKLLDDSYFEVRLRDWMLTMRKKNVAVVLLTQRVSHLTQSAAGEAVLETAVTKLIYPNSSNTEKELEPLSLTESESMFLQSSNVGNRLVLVKSGEDSVVLDMDLSSLGGGLGILGGGQGEKLPKGWREKENFWQELM